MPIRFAQEPTQARSAVQEGLDRLADRDTPLARRDVDASKLEPSQPHVVYDLAADAIAAGGGLDTAVKNGVRYLLEASGSPVAAAEIHPDEAGQLAHAATINLGPYVDATARAISRVGSDAAVQQGAYELRLLRFAAIFLMALWLKPDSPGEPEIVYPIDPAPPPLHAEQTYTPEQFLEAIRPLAEKRAAAKQEGSVP